MKVEITEENIERIINNIFSEYLYEGLECDSEEEYNAYEDLFENYFRVALLEAKDKFIKERS